METMQVPKGIYLDASMDLIYPQGAKMTDGFPEDLRPVLHPHWESFPPQNPLILYCFGIFLMALSVICLVINASILYVFVTAKSLRSAVSMFFFQSKIHPNIFALNFQSNIFTVNLALSDFLMMLTHCPLVSMNIFMSKFFLWGKYGCYLYACLGGIFGTTSILTMVAIGWERYNIIVKGMASQPITLMKALIIVAFIWIYAIISACPPFFFQWGGYNLEGLLYTCTYDFLTEDWNHQSFILATFVNHWLLPMLLIVYFYSRIVKAVIAHEAALKAQAKKMGLKSIKYEGSDQDSAEIRIAKVATTNVLIWALAWTPYAMVCLIGCFGNRSIITPLVSQIPAFFAKTACCFNPMVFALSHPKLRQAMAEKLPCLGIKEDFDPPHKSTDHNDAEKGMEMQ